MHGLTLKHYAEPKETDTKECKLYDYTYVQFWNRKKINL